jgi:hypothetical protein
MWVMCGMGPCGSAQVNGQDLSADAVQLRARLCGRGVWGWLQLPARLLRPHRPAIAALLALRPELAQPLARQLREALAGLGRGPAAPTQPGHGGGPGAGRLVVAHVRRGDFATRLEGGGDEAEEAEQEAGGEVVPRAGAGPLRCQPPFDRDGEHGGVWADTCVRRPAAPGIPPHVPGAPAARARSAQTPPHRRVPAAGLRPAMASRCTAP